MDDREGGGRVTYTPTTFVTTSKRRRFSRFRLLWLLLLFIPLSISLTIYSHVRRTQLHSQRIRNAYDRMNTIGVDANFAVNGDCVIYSRTGNVTDDDLKALIPVGSGEAGMGSHKVVRLDLRGSKISDEAAAEFRQAAPDCELIR
jgi:hypothetical protein